MADTNVPVIGKMPKWALWATAAGGVLVVYLVWKDRSGSSSTSSTTAAGASGTTDTSGLGATDTSGDTIDPNTGYPYGSIEDQEAQAGEIPSYDYSGETAGYPSGDGTTTAYTTAPTTNAEWTQAAQSALTSIGYDPETVASALGVYLSRGSMSAAQVAIVQVAISEVGYPPVGTFPLQVAATTSTTTTTPQVTVPNVVGQSQEAALEILSATGLKGTGSPVVKGKVLYVTTQSPKAGTKVAKGSTVKLTSKLR